MMSSKRKLDSRFSGTLKFITYFDRVFSVQGFFWRVRFLAEPSVLCLILTKLKRRRLDGETKKGASKGSSEVFKEVNAMTVRACLRAKATDYDDTSITIKLWPNCVCKCVANWLTRKITKFQVVPTLYRWRNS